MSAAAIRTALEAIRHEATLEQRRATEPRASAWAEANAGTGKTKVLTDRVVRLLLDDVPPQKILCLTFTKAAAAEMRNRLAAMLGRWAFADAEKLAGELDDVLGRRPSAEETVKARRLFARMLDCPGGISIQTIHAFCQSLLGRFPLEAGVAPNARVLDEAQSDELLTRARDAQLATLAATAADTALHRSLAAVGGRISDAEYVGLLGGLLGERRQLLELDGLGMPEVERRLRRALGVPLQGSVEELHRESCADAAFELKRLRAAVTALARGSTSDIARAQAVGDWIAAAVADRIATFDDYCQAYLTRDGGIRKSLATRAVQQAMPDVHTLLEDEARRLLAVIERMRGVRLIESTMALLHLGIDVLHRYLAFKCEQAVLDYDDLILAARRLLEAPGSPAWVLYKLDGGIDHVLIDEAQDTNPDQWEVVRKLTDEFFAQEGPLERPRTVFAVGDAKQSIFSFQRADPAKLEEMRRDFGQRSEAAKLAFTEVPLIHSFRSTEAVLAAVDTVFAADPARAGVIKPEAKDPLQHRAIRLGQEGVVEVWPLVADPEAPAEAKDYRPDAPPTEGRSSIERLARMIAAHCKSLIGHERNAATGAMLTAGNIMILVRRRNALVPAMVRALKQADIGVAGVDRLRLADALAVQDLMALGRFVLLPQDDLNLAGLLKSPLIGLDEDALFELAWKRQGRLWAALQARRDDARFADAAARLTAWLSVADFAPPFDLFAQVLGAERGRERLLERLGREAQEPIDEFLARALEYQRSEPPSMQGFLRWFEEGGNEIKRDLEQGRRSEVRILTVHASKGLQAPVVYLPDTVRTPRTSQDRLLWPEGESEALPLWLPRADDANEAARSIRDAVAARGREEHHRLLYVAMTRAADRLYVCGALGRKLQDKDCWYDLVRGALQARAVAVDDHRGNPQTPRRFAFDAGALIGAADGWDGEGLRVRFGEPTKVAEDTASDAALTEALPNWAMTAPPAETVPLQLAPSRSVDAAADAAVPQRAPEPPPISPLAAEGPDRFKRGTLIHRLLQTLPELPPAARRAAAERFLRQPGHEIAAGDVVAWTAETLAVLDLPQSTELFGPQSRAEVPVTGIVSRGGRQWTVSGQIDRLSVAADEILIVDFKTNRPPPQRVEDVALLYRRQMALYRALLGELYPGRKVRCFLLWTDGPRLMELPATLLDAAI